MLDQRALLAGLVDYRDSVERQVASLRDDFQEVAHTWANLDECFAGNAADEFRPIWEGTSQGFREYIEHTTAILRVLSERIEYLRDFEKSGRLDV